MARIHIEWPNLGVQADYVADPSEEGEEPTWTVTELGDDPLGADGRGILRRDLRFFFGPDFVDAEFEGDYLPDVIRAKAERIQERWPGAEVVVETSPEEGTPEEEPEFVF